MSFKVNDPSEEIDINFVLLHGLDGNGNTFINENSKVSFQDCIRATFPRSKILTYEYPNNSVRLLSSKHPLPIEERAENFAFGLINELNNDKSVHFICHSMGGLILKETLLTATQQSADSITDIKALYDRTRTITFYATPHLGSALATTLNYINLAYFDGNVLNIVINELKHDNPFLVRLKNNFNELISKGQNKNIRILSLIEGQPMSMLGKKIVPADESKCGLDAEYEQKVELDFDHSQICKPEQVKDRRFTQFAHFVINTLQSTKEVNPIEDEKEGNEMKLSTNDVMFVDPRTNSIHDLDLALYDYEKRPSVKRMTNLIRAVFQSNAQDYSQSQVSKMLKGNLMKQNTKILNSLLNTQEFMRHVEESRIHESIELSNEYWRLLKKSKQIITDKQSQINKLLKVSQRWKKILTKRIDFENDEGKAPSKMDAKYMSYVQKSLCDYFSAGSKDTETMAEKWAKLTEKLAQQYMWWKNKYEWFKDWKQRKWEKMKEKMKSSWGCVEMIGSAVKWLGAAVAVCAAVAAIFCTGGIALIVAGVALSSAVVGYGVSKVAKSQQQNWDQQKRKASKVEQCVKQVMDAFNTMKKDGSIMDKLFSDFGRLLCEPKKRAKEIEDDVEEAEGDDINWYMMSDNVDDIIKSTGELKKVCVDLIEQIDKSQTNFYAE